MRSLPDALEARRQAFLASLSARRPLKEEEKPRSSELDSNSVNLLLQSGLHPEATLTELYSLAGLHSVEGKRALENLIAQAMARLHKIARLGKGRNPEVLELLPRGIAELRNRQIEPAPRVLRRGGFLHDVYARLLAKWAQRKGFRFWFERTLGAKAFDFVYEESGDLSGMEICLSGSAKRNAEAGRKASLVEGVSHVFLLFEKRTLMSQVEKELSHDKMTMKKVSVGLLPEYFPCAGGESFQGQGPREEHVT